MSKDTGIAPRLVSLDTFRGLVMCMLAVNGFAVASTARKLGFGPTDEIETSYGQMWQWLGFHNSHPAWNSQFYVIGCSVWDLIQPAFMFMVGVAMPYSYASRRKRGASKINLNSHALIRAVVLVLLGVFLASHRAGIENNRLLTNVLAQIGLGYFFVFLLLDRSAKVQIAVGSAVLVVYWAWMAFSPAPNPLPEPAAESIQSFHVLDRFGPPFAILTNSAADVDVALYTVLHGEEIAAPHKAGYATLNFIPAAITILMGVLAGSLLRGEGDELGKLKRLIVGGIICMAIALIASYTVCPIVKRIWTPSWTLFSGAYMLWATALLYWVVDILGFKKWTFPFVVVGMNSLAIYLMSSLMKSWILGLWQTYLGKDIFAGPYGPSLQAAALFLVLWLFCFYLYRNKIFFRI
tara:strand:- start:214826 stop:216046 length:1221 start_codon:yes stop_codon:yes gene_type:complete